MYSIKITKWFNVFSTMIPLHGSFYSKPMNNVKYTLAPLSTYIQWYKLPLVSFKLESVEFGGESSNSLSCPRSWLWLYIICYYLLKMNCYIQYYLYYTVVLPIYTVLLAHKLGFMENIYINKQKCNDKFVVQFPVFWGKPIPCRDKNEYMTCKTIIRSYFVFKHGREAELFDHRRYQINWKLYNHQSLRTAKEIMPGPYRQ